MSASDSFLSAFSEITGTGNFHSTGAAPFFLPELQVKGLGEIAFPLPRAQAKELIALAEVAPYGKGTRTLLDDQVRKCWQLDATCFSFDSPRWRKFLKLTLATIREDLGISGKISAKPYKLLLYGKGGHFKAHKDTDQMGQLEDDDYDYRRRRYDDDDTPSDGTMGEIYDEDLTISHWRTKSDRKIDLGSYRVEHDLLITSEPFGVGEPDEQEAEGYTGNAGCTMDYIRSHFLDLDHITIRKGRPYTLTCTKNDQSHQQALTLRAGDVALLDRLTRLKS